MPISTTTQIDVEQALRDDLSQYLCGSIWNHPLTELRRNITLRAMNKGYCTKHICDIGSTYVALPDARYSGRTHEYYVYAAARCCMGGLVVDCEQSDLSTLPHYGDWIRLDQYLNKRPFDLRIHSVHGEWLNRNRIFIKNHPTEDMFLLAVDAQMADKLLGDYNFSTVYMSVYYDSDNNIANLEQTSPKIYSEYIEQQDQINDLYAEYMSCDHDKTMFFINGRLSYPSSLLDMTIGDYVEMVYDPDIIANIVLDMVNDRDNHLYRSEIDGTYKYIIHIPKSKNPNNLIITHNTCDVFVSPLNTAPVENANLKGLFVHRFDTSYREYVYVETTDTVYRKGRDYFLYNIESDSYTKKYVRVSDYGTPITEKLYVRATEYLSDHLITQITHNDFGVSEKLIQPYMDVIGSSECSLRVVIRRHAKSNILDRDCNFIKLLYQFDDATILDFLNGKNMAHCPFWQASELEKSEWIKVLFEVPRSIYEESTEHYLNALGYYNSACVISPRVASGAFNPQNTHALDFTIPRSLQSSQALDSLFTINGRLLRQTDYTDIKDMQYLHFDISNDVPISKGDKLIAEIFEKKQMRFEYFTPTSSSPTFEIPEDSAEFEFELYLVNDSFVPVSDYFTDHYVNNEELKGYKKVEDVDEYLMPVVNIYRTETVDFSCVDTGCDNPSHQGSKAVKILTKRILTFKSTAWNKTFLISSKSVYGRYTEQDIEMCGGNSQLSTLSNPDGTRTCTDLLHSGKLMLTGRKWRSDEQESVPILDKSWTIIPYCNGRELVKDVDYSDILVKDSSGYVAYRTLIFCVGGLGESASINDSDYYKSDSYLKYEDNEFDILLTDDNMFSRFDGFAFSNEAFNPNTPSAKYNTGHIEELLPIVYWFNELSKLVVDGSAIYRPYLKNGVLEFHADFRNGALYGLRGVVPSRTRSFIEKYKDNIDDLEKLAKIVKYIRSLDEQTYDKTVIAHSHHITSIAANCLVKDVITGAKELYWTAAANQIEEQISEYRTLSKYDPALNGSLKDLAIESSGSDIVNDKYRLTDITATGNDRVWRTGNNKCILAFNTSKNRWEISVNSIYGMKVYYYATSNDEHDPWNLGLAKEDGALPLPIINNEGVDTKYVDVLPSYTSDIHEVEEDIMLRRCIDALLPADTTKDGATTL